MARSPRTQRLIEKIEPINRWLLERPVASVVGLLLLLGLIGLAMVLVTERTDGFSEGPWGPVYQGILAGVFLYQLAMPPLYPRIVNARPDEVLLLGLTWGAAGFLWLSAMLINFGIPAWVLVVDFPITAVSVATAMWLGLRSRPAS